MLRYAATARAVLRKIFSSFGDCSVKFRVQFADGSDWRSYTEGAPELTIQGATRDADVMLTVSSIEPTPASWTKDAQIQIETTTEHQGAVETMLTSISFR